MYASTGQYTGATPTSDWQGGYAGGVGSYYMVPEGYGSYYMVPEGYSGPMDKAKAWWDGRSTGEKVAIGIGGAAVLWMLVNALMPGRRRYTPNKRRRRKKVATKARRQRRAKQAALRKIRGKRGRARTGKILTLKSGKRYGSLKPKKKYWNMGARRPSDYAAPDQWGYPLIFRGPTGRVNATRTRRHIGAAKFRFNRNKRRYPMKLRRQIARNINKAAKRYGLPANVKP